MSAAIPLLGISPPASRAHRYAQPDGMFLVGAKLHAKPQHQNSRRGWVWGLFERPSGEQIDSMVDTTRLLTFSEMRELFRDCEIKVERLLWVFPKSYIAFRKSSSRISA